MQKLIEFLDDIHSVEAFHVNISYSKTTDWSIDIYKQGCAKDGSDLYVFTDSDVDIEYLAAEAQIALKNWMRENRGGY